MDRLGGTESGLLAPPSSEVFAGACVVIVDDHRVDTMLLERLLAAAGVAEIHTVTDATKAVARCQEVDADLVLLDLHMPGMDGHEVLGRLRDSVADFELLPVVVLTADATTEARDRALRAGAKDFLTKPLDHVEVVLRLRSLLESRARYATLQHHNAALQADLHRHAEAEQHRAHALQVRNQRIDTALQPQTLQMVFQPIVDLQTGATIGAEALARFVCEPDRPPDQWFSEAVAIGRGAELELAAVRAAVAQLDRLPTGLFLAVNVSPATALLPELGRVLDGLELGRLVLELTEHTPVADYSALLTALGPRRDQGLRIAADDTGAGYAGLDHLLQLRPEVIKLDTALTHDIDNDPSRRALARALVAFAAETDATIIAEGIETPEELAVLQQLGIRWGQGYHLGRPAPLSTLLRDCGQPFGRSAVTGV